MDAQDAERHNISGADGDDAPEAMPQKLPPKQLTQLTAFANEAMTHADRVGINQTVTSSSGARVDFGDSKTRFAYTTANPERTELQEQFADKSVASRRTANDDHTLAGGDTVRMIRPVGYPKTSTMPCQTCGRFFTHPPRCAEFIPNISRTHTRADRKCAPSSWDGNWCGWHCAFSQAVFHKDEALLCALRLTCVRMGCTPPLLRTLVPPHLLRLYVQRQARRRERDLEAQVAWLRGQLFQSVYGGGGGGDRNAEAIHERLDREWREEAARQQREVEAKEAEVAAPDEVATNLMRKIDSAAAAVADEDEDGGDDDDDDDDDSAGDDLEHAAIRKVRHILQRAQENDEEDGDGGGGKGAEDEDEATPSANDTVSKKPLVDGIRPVDDPQDGEVAFNAFVTTYAGRHVPSVLILKIREAEGACSGTVFSDEFGEAVNLRVPANVQPLKPTATGAVPQFLEYVRQRQAGVPHEHVNLSVPQQPVSRRRGLLRKPTREAVDATQRITEKMDNEEQREGEVGFTEAEVVQQAKEDAAARQKLFVARAKVAAKVAAAAKKRSKKSGKGGKTPASMPKTAAAAERTAAARPPLPPSAVKGGRPTAAPKIATTQEVQTTLQRANHFVDVGNVDSDGEEW